MRKAWRNMGEHVFRALGWLPPVQEVRIEYATKTKFRGRKNQLQLPEWQSLAEIFHTNPDFEDFLQIQLDNLDALAVTISDEPAGDRQRLVLQAQRQVLLDMIKLPETAAARVRVMLQPKKVPSLKGNEHAYP